MQLTLDDACRILGRTPGTLKALLQGCPDHWSRANEGGETWSPFDVVGHLVHEERADWIPRALIILREGEGRAFDPFDRFAQFRESEGRTLEELLEEFQGLREANLKTLRELGLEEKNLARKGRHPSLGTVTLGELLSTWVVHDLGHIAQITRVMARQYRKEVGPWAEYLPVLNR